METIPLQYRQWYHVSKLVLTNHDSQINSIKPITFREKLLTAGNDICSPQRNQVLPEHLEVLYLLKVLNLPVKNSAEYADAIELLSEGLV